MKMALDDISKLNPNANEWQIILGVSEKNKLELQKARALAIEHLTPTISRSPITSIKLARRYKVKEWLRDGLRGIVESPCISEEEQKELGCETTCRLYRIREKYRRRGCKSCKGKKSGYTGVSGESILADLDHSFWDELTVCRT